MSAILSATDQPAASSFAEQGSQAFGRVWQCVIDGCGKLFGGSTLWRVVIIAIPIITAWGIAFSLLSQTAALIVGTVTTVLILYAGLTFNKDIENAILQAQVDAISKENLKLSTDLNASQIEASRYKLRHDQRTESLERLQNDLQNLLNAERGRCNRLIGQAEASKAESQKMKRTVQALQRELHDVKRDRSALQLFLAVPTIENQGGK